MNRLLTRAATGVLLLALLSGCSIAVPVAGTLYSPAPTTGPQEPTREMPPLATLAPRPYVPQVTAAPTPRPTPTPYYYLKRTLPPMISPRASAASASGSLLATPLPDGAALVPALSPAGLSPDAGAIMVFMAVPDGMEYHARQDCELLPNEGEIGAMPLSQAVEWGLVPCSECGDEIDFDAVSSADAGAPPTGAPRNGLGSQAFAGALYDSGQTLVARDGDTVYHLFQCAELAGHQSGYVVIQKANAEAEGYTPCPVCYGERR